MAEPGNPPVSDHDRPDPDVHAYDDLIGFSSASALAGATRERPSPSLHVSERPEEEPEQAGLFDAPAPRRTRLTPAQPDRSIDPEPVPQADDGVSIPPIGGTATRAFLSSVVDRMPDMPGRTGPAGYRPASRPVPVADITSGQPDAPEGAMGLYSVYALILFAVPTMGLAAVIALIAVTVRPLPGQALARSHFAFQKRTLMIAAVAALAGALMIVVNLGVFVLFIVAVWLLVRGTWGLMNLVRGETIARPYQWWIGAR